MCLVSGVQNLPLCNVIVKAFIVKIWDFSTKGFIHYDLNNAWLLGKTFKKLQKAFGAEKITGACLHHVWATGEVSSVLDLRSNHRN